MTKSVAGMEPGRGVGVLSIAISPVGPGVDTPDDLRHGHHARLDHLRPAPAGHDLHGLRDGGARLGRGPDQLAWRPTPTTPRSPSAPPSRSRPVTGWLCALTNTLQPGSLTIDKQVSSAPGAERRRHVHARLRHRRGQRRRGPDRLHADRSLRVRAGRRGHQGDDREPDAGHDPRRTRPSTGPPTRSSPADNSPAV